MTMPEGESGCIEAERMAADRRRAELVQENGSPPPQENIQLWNWLFDTIELPLAKLQGVRGDGRGCHGT